MKLSGIIVVLLLCVVIPLASFYFGERSIKRFKRSLGVNIFSFFAVLLLATGFIFSGNAYGSETAAAAASSTEGWKYIAAALSVGLGSIGAGMAVAAAASAAIGAVSENEGIFGKTLVFVGLAEGIAIYGLVISFMILFS